MRTAVVLAALLGFAPALSATVVLPAEFREIVNGSQVIVHGRVADVRAEWVDGRRRIETVVTIEPREVFRGAAAGSVTFRVPGGQVGRYKRVTVGAPEFQPGEEVVLFLRANGPAVPRVFGMSQGVFRVRVDERTGRRTVALPILMSGAVEPQRITRGSGDRRPLPLDEFASTLRTVIRQGGAR